MDRISEVLISVVPALVLILFLAAAWLVIRKIAGGLSNRMNNSDNYKEDTLRVLEEIRDELKELNRNK